MEKISPEFEKIRFIFVQVKLLHPFPSRLLEDTLNNITGTKTENSTTKLYSNSKTTIISIEMNYLAQLDILLKQNTTVITNYNILKYNGRPMSLSELYESFTRIISNNTGKRVILENGV